MKYKAIVGFSGVISMSKGEVMDIKDKTIISDLTNAGYIEPIEKPKKEKTSAKGE